MMREVNLLDLYPKIKRPVDELSRSTPENQAISKKFGFEYFDGDRKYGYGGYYYDGRWKPVARRFVEYYNLPKGSFILDIGCAKGFLVKEFLDLGMRPFGIDISNYAIKNAHPDVDFCVSVSDARDLYFPNRFFDLVISINTVHNLDLEGCKRAIAEMERVSRKYKYLQVDSWFNEEQRKKLMKWRLTAVTLMSVEDWRDFLKGCGYRGDYFWTICE